jgi:hypothetical protein
MRRLLLFTLFFFSPFASASRTFKFTLQPLTGYVGVQLANPGTLDQHVKITYLASGSAVLSKHPNIQDPSSSSVVNCTTSQLCTFSNYFTLAGGKFLYSGVSTVPGGAPVPSDNGMSITIDIQEDQGVVTAYAYNQFFATGQNLPFPVVVNGGRPF